MKKNRIFILGIVTMFVAILSLTLVSGTLARYTSIAGSEDTVKVAKWDVKVNGTKLEDPENSTNTFNFDLFNTIKDTKDGNDETDVVAGLIAPGTQGQFTLALLNASEVNATYSIDYTVTNTANIPIKFSIDDGDSWGTLEDVTDIAINMNASDSYTIQWKWAFDGDDVLDTTLGLDEATLNVEAVVTFTQVD